MYQRGSRWTDLRSNLISGSLSFTKISGTSYEDRRAIYHSRPRKFAINAFMRRQHILRRFCTVAGNSASSCLSCPHVSARLPLDRFTVEFDIGEFKFYKNIGHFIRRPQGDLSFSAAQIRNKRIYVQQSTL